MTAPKPPTAPTTPGGSFLTRKYGPLPVWVYMLVAVALAVVYSMYQKNKAASTNTGTTATSTPDQTPPQVFQTTLTTGPETININDSDETPPPVPPVAGRPVPPVVTPVAPPPARPGPTPAPGGEWVTVGKWTAKNPPWNSTLWGIAQSKLGNGQNWPRIWNAPQNATLKSRRKDPKLIQPGDKVFVPK